LRLSVASTSTREHPLEEARVGELLPLGLTERRGELLAGCRIVLHRQTANSADDRTGFPSRGGRSRQVAVPRSRASRSSARAMPSQITSSVADTVSNCLIS
jgi:hypothetical protein